jgi:predicted adenylyl cyclase CyaB
MIEVEIKSLLGDKAVADKIKSVIETDFKAQYKSSEEQKTHYFIAEDYTVSLTNLATPLSTYFDRATLNELKIMAQHGSKLSIRSRFTGTKTLFIAKYSLASQDKTSDNSISRRELEKVVELTQEELDDIIQNSGFSYQAKWSRYRENYSNSTLNFALDRNAGYGWILEIEKIVSEEHLVPETIEELRSVLSKLELKEIDPSRLDRMFAYYNKNWEHYYGTDKIFVIE